MSLADEINAKSKEIHSDSYSMSLGEIANLYKDGELILHPEFQREFRWTEEQKSNLIESVLLGIPLPPIFVVQEEGGIWDVIDGLQRLSTFFEFMGILKNKDDQLIPASTLKKTKFLPSLEGKKWEANDDIENSFTTGQRIDFKRVKIGVTIITKDSDSEAKYELFQRLNTGGSSLTDQEVRNCLLLMVNPNFYNYIKSLSMDENFIATSNLSDRQIEEKFDMELVCRYLAGKNTPVNDFRNLADINEFISNRMIEFAKDQNFDYKKEQKDFQDLFAILNSLDVHPFAKYNKQKDSFMGMFLISTYEVIAMGLGKYITNYSSNDLPDIKDKIKKLWENQDFLSVAGTGKSAKTRMAQCVEIGERLFKK